jgi:hypothetical protein
LPEAVTLLGVVAVAGGPLPRSVALSAASLTESARPLIQRLERVGLLRLTRIDGNAAIEPYHHRIRDAILDGALPTEITSYHKRLACTLEAGAERDPEALLVHHLGAGDLEAAILGAAGR